MIRVTIRYFAIARELCGHSVEEREISEGTTAGELLEALQEQCPPLARLGRALLLMVNRRYVSPDHVLQSGDEVAVIPPVSGGGGPFRVTDEPLQPEAIRAAVADPQAGAIVTFIGTTRNHARGRTVRYLEYEAYAEAAEACFAQIAAEIADRWGIEHVAIVHRTGRVDVGEASVVIAVASPHRAEAFAACAYAIDRLKQIAPIWKKEVYDDGEVWVGSEAAYQAAFGHGAAAQGTGGAERNAPQTIASTRSPGA